MALEQLLASLTRETAERAAAIVEAGRTEAEAIVARGVTAQRARLEERVAERQRAATAALEEALARARQAAEREVLAARGEVLARVRTRAEQFLRAGAASPDVAAAAARLLREAATYLGEAGGVVHCDSDLRDALDPVATALGLTLAPDLAQGIGSVLASTDGRMQVVATLDDALERCWPDEAIRIGALLEATS
ncbi:MAG: V-type ATP synthase subunit E family protein [Gemmatimonadales bacterium]|jgi:vacuolar-type H+-ATPase subunit E/Vma4|nr:V-type ATP synthase subunit E family protein [Gemmatimonadales bacterium]